MRTTKPHNTFQLVIETTPIYRTIKILLIPGDIHSESVRIWQSFQNSTYQTPVINWPAMGTVSIEMARRVAQAIDEAAAIAASIDDWFEE